jgi:hypothetical protein
MRLRSLRVEEQPQLMVIPMIDIILFFAGFFHDEYIIHGGAAYYAGQPAAGDCRTAGYTAQY